MNKDYKYLNLSDFSTEPKLLSYYQRLRIFNENSLNLSKKLEKLVEKKASFDEFSNFMKLVEKESFSIEKLESYKHNLSEYYAWEQNVAKALNNKNDIAVQNFFINIT